MIFFTLFRYSIIAIGLGKAENEDLLSIAQKEQRVLILRDLRELYIGKSGHKILTDLINDPDYGKPLF